MLDPPSSQQVRVELADGSSTVLTVHPSGDPSAPVVLCLPAMGVRSEYYEVLADVLAEQGFTAVLADLRGTGSSSVRASRRVSFGYADMLELELPAITESLCQRFDTDQIVVVGHSLGGQLGMLFAATSTRVSHVVLVASGSAWYRTMPGLRAVTRFAGLQLLFVTTLLWGHLPTWFPFAGREARRVIQDWGFEAMTGRYRISRSAVNYEAALSTSRVPTMFVTFPSDTYVPRPSTEHLAAKLEAAHLAWRELPPDRFGLAETDHFRWVSRPQAVAELVAEWAGANPSSARTGGRS